MYGTLGPTIMDCACCRRWVNLMEGCAHRHRHIYIYMGCAI